MIKLSDIQSKVYDACRAFDDSLVVHVRLSADDPDCICIRVFGAAENAVDRMEEMIFDLEESLFDDKGPILLPMVKNLKVTEEYYPDIYQEIRANKCAKVLVSANSSNEPPKWIPLSGLKGVWEDELVSGFLLNTRINNYVGYSDISVPVYENAASVSPSIVCEQAEYADAA